MIEAISWYVIVSLLGLLAWPLAFRMLPGLADRGYTISRALGLLLVGYLFWLLGTLGLLQNTVGGILFSAIIVGSVSVWAYLTRPDTSDSLAGWVKTHRSQMAIAELLFGIAFAAWVIVRAYNPELDSTERPMELAFLNGVVHSPAFPPLDPWLSGYSISYYYFGYVLMGMVTKLASIPVSVAFNIGIAHLFALTLLGSYGLVYNLMAGNNERRPVFSALLGPLFVGIVGNLEGFLELVRSLNLPFVSYQFWKWLDIEDLSDPVTGSLWPPDKWRFWWWFRASRVIRDRDISGMAIGLQPIDEFPMFSHLLGDMHPHVLALPFAILALALAFNALAQREPLSKKQFALYTLCFGGLAFLNTWDLPIYLFVLIAALVIRQIRADGRLIGQTLWRPLLSGMMMLALGILAYLTWYIGFTSQAGGILPNALFPTRLHQFLVMFGPFVVILLWFLGRHAFREWKRMDWRKAAILGVGLLVLLVFVASSLGFAALRADPGNRASFINSVGVSTESLSQAQIDALVPAAVQAVIQYRLSHPLTALLLTGMIVLVLAAMLPRPQPPVEDAPQASESDPTFSFVFLLILTGAMLTLGPEFVYLRDVFGQRLNTVFKFYFAAWLLFAVAAAFAAYTLFRQQRALPRWLFAGVTAILIAAGLTYPLLAIPNKTGYFVRGEGDPPPTLDGIDYIRRLYPGDYRAIIWLQQNASPGSVILEAVGGSYTYYARVSRSTGLPTLIGWPGHETQWRGPLFAELAGGREAVVREIYNTTSVARATQLLAENHVTYVYVGSLERDPSYASPLGVQKFDRFLNAVYRDADVVIYRADQPLVQGIP